MSSGCMGVTKQIWSLILVAVAALGCSLAVYMVFNVSMILIGVVWNEALDVANLLVWQSVMILTSFMFWIAWLRRSTRSQVIQETY